MKDGGKVVIRLETRGAEQLKRDLVAIGPAGEKALRDLELNAKRADPAFKSLDDSIRGAGDSLDHMGGQSEAAGSKISKGAAVAGAAIAALSVAVVKAFGIAHEALDDFSNTVREARDLGISTDLFQALDARAIETGVSIGDVNRGLETYKSRLADASQGQGGLVSGLGKSHPELLKQIAATGDFAAQIDLVARAMAAAKTPTEQMNVAKSVFGSQAETMVRVLGDAETGMDDFIDRAREMNLVVENEVLVQAEAMKTEISEAARVLDLELKQGFDDLAPIILIATQRAGDFVKLFREFTDNPGKTFGDPFGDIVVASGANVIDAEAKLDALAEKREKIQADIEKFQASIAEGGTVAAQLFPRVNLAQAESRLEKINRQIEEAQAGLAAARAEMAGFRTDADGDDQPGSGGGGGSGGGFIIPPPPPPSAKKTDREKELESLVRAAQRAEDQLLTTDEKVAASLAALAEARRAGIIASDEELAALQASMETKLREKDVRDATRESLAKERAIQSEVAQILSAIETPMERYTEAVDRLNALKAEGRLTQDEYNRALEVETEVLDRGTGAAQRRLSVERELAAVRSSIETPEERLAARRKALDDLRESNGTDGGLTDGEYERAIRKAEEAYEGLNKQAATQAEIQGLINAGLNGQIKSWEDVGRVALDMLAQIITKALFAKDAIGGSGSGGFAGIIGAGIADSLGFGTSGSGSASPSAVPVTTDPGITYAKTSAPAGLTSGYAKPSAAALNAAQPVFPDYPDSRADYAAAAAMTTAMITRAGQKLTATPGAGSIILNNYGTPQEVTKTEQRENSSGGSDTILTMRDQISDIAREALTDTQGQEAMDRTYGLRPGIGRR